MKTYKVTEECISCHACVEVADKNFKMGEEIAYVYKQPENEAEENQCQDALEVCPVNAIESEEKNINTVKKEPILANHKVKETLDKYPHLKDVLLGFSDKFKKLLNPVMYNTLAQFASFNEAAKVSGISVCEILHVLNKANGTEDLLHKIAPECVKDKDFQVNILEFSDDITWEESLERYIYNHDSMPEIIEKLSNLKPQSNIVIISVKEPVELIKTAKGLDLLVNIEKSREYRVSVFNPEKEKNTNWQERKENFEQLDVRTMQSDPFDIIIQKAYATPEDEGFILIQRFEPYPIINMLAEMGFEHETEYVSQSEIWVYFYKKPIDTDENSDSIKTEVIIQSATPVAYPVIMRLLQSDVIRKNIAIKELKVWEETEKHLAWIANGKADISFSALITSIKLQNADIKIPALFVWDNFVILTRYKAESFEDIKGKTIYTPLFEEAPPAKITKYLIKAKGLNPGDFNFAYGKPFGRPEEIYTAFVQGQADTVILREPEASYALKIMQDRGEEVSILSYNEIWNEVNPGFGSFPNAGIVFKGEFVRQNPELAKVFLNELKSAIDWVNKNKPEAADLSFDMMRQPADRVELFLNRVNFDYVSGDTLIKKVKDYMKVLEQQNIIESKLEESYYEIFTM
jgi:NitT/TauT family transport system substrate-binding protein